MHFKKIFPQLFFLTGGGLILFAFYRYFQIVRVIDIALSRIGSLCGEPELHTLFSNFIIFFFPFYWEWLMLSIGTKKIIKNSPVQKQKIIGAGIIFGIMNIIAFMLSSILVFGQNKAELLPLAMIFIVYIAGRTLIFQKFFGENLTKKQTIIFNIVLNFIACFFLLIMFTFFHPLVVECFKQAEI